MADDPTPERPDDFFSQLPMFGDLAKALQGQGPLNWDAARQFAQLGATGGAPEANVDPAVRLSFAELTRIAWFHVADVMGSGDAGARAAGRHPQPVGERDARRLPPPLHRDGHRARRGRRR